MQERCREGSTRHGGHGPRATFGIVCIQLPRLFSQGRSAYPGPVRSLLAVSTIFAAVTWLTGPASAQMRATQSSTVVAISGPNEESEYDDLATNASGSYLIAWSPDFLGGPFGILAGSTASGILPSGPESVGDHASDGSAAVAVSPAGTQGVLWSQRSGPRGNRRWSVVIATRSTAASPWTLEEIQPPAAGEVGSIALSFGPQGQALAVWARDRARPQIWAATLPAGGGFAAPRLISQTAGAEPSDFQIDFDASGRATLTWTQETFLRARSGQPSRVGSVRRGRPKPQVKTAQADAAGNFAAPSQVGSGCQNSMLGVADSGAAAIALRCDSGHGRRFARRIRLARRPAGGAFAPAKVISGAGKNEVEPSLVVRPDGRFAAAWIDRTRLRHRSFERVLSVQGPLAGGATRPISAIGRKRIVPSAFLIGDPDGVPFMVILDQRNDLSVAALEASGKLGAGETVSRGRPMIDLSVAIDRAGRGLAVWIFPGALEQVQGAGFAVPR